MQARLPLRAGKPAAKGQRTCDIAPPLSKTCVFDLTRGRVVREDQCRQTSDRPRSAGTWRPPTGRSFVFLGLGVPLASAARDSANGLPIRPRNRAVGQSDLHRKAQAFSADLRVCTARKRSLATVQGVEVEPILLEHQPHALGVEIVRAFAL